MGIVEEFGCFADNTTLLSNFGGNSVSIFSDGGQAACREITDVDDQNADGRMLDNEATSFDQN